MKKLIAIAAALAALLTTGAVGQAATSDDAQVKVVSGSSDMPLSEVSRLVGAATFATSAEGMKTAATLTAASTTKHCYGKVYWKAGENVTGQTIWKEWNHTAWCGYPYVKLLYKTVHGYTDTYTSVSWNSGDESWSKNRDQNSIKAAWTRGHAHFSQCAGPVCITSEDINTHMHIFANGYWKGS